MHRQICDSFSAIDWSNLPPEQPSDTLRLLVVSTEALGGKTYNRQLEHYTGARKDVDAVHVRSHPTIVSRLLTRTVPLGPRRLAVTDLVRLWGWTLYRPLAKLLQTRRFDAVHATRQGTALAASRLRNRLGFFLSVTADSTVPAYLREFAPTSAGVCPREREIFATADLISPYSEWVSRSLVDDYKVLPERIQIVRPAPPPELRRAAVRDRDEGLVRLLFVGNDHIRKGLPRLLRWHQARWASVAELHVVSTKAPVDRSARNVVWHGAVPYGRLLGELMPRSDILVVPTHLDTYGQVYIEAMSCGLPAIGTRQAAIPEIIEDNVTGYTCPADDDSAFVAAIERLLMDPALRRSMSLASLRRADELFDSDRNFNEFLDLLKTRSLHGSR